MPRGLLAATAAIALIPLAVLAALAALGFTAPIPATLAAAAVTLAAFALGFVLLRDLELLARAVRQAATESAPRAAGAATPAIPQIEAIAGDVERLSRATAARTALLARLRRADEAIVEKLPDPLIVLADDRSICRTNAAATAAFGADIQAVLRHPGLRAAIDRAFAQSPAERTAQTAALTLASPVAREVQATVIIMDPPLSDGGRVVAVLSDRTRERAVERMRADFVANASHELRTPLASLIGFIDTLRGPAAEDKPAQQRFLGIMAEQAARMNRLIDDLLSLSRIELTEHQPPSERVDLADLLPRLAAGFEPRLAERSITLDLQIADHLPDVIGDADQLEQVAQNLFDNAVKYGRDGGRVSVSAQAASAPARSTAAAPRWPTRPGIVLSVTDEGQGIPREHLARLTERFYRVDKGRSRNVGGTGLGLAIVKHIVNRHRGQLLIESEVGKGTTVTVWLPQAPTNAPDAAVSAAAAPPAETGAADRA